MFRNPASHFLRIPIETSPIAWTRHTPPLLVSPHAHLLCAPPPLYNYSVSYCNSSILFSAASISHTLYLFAIIPYFTYYIYKPSCYQRCYQRSLSVLTYSLAKASWILECMNPALSGTKCYISVIKRTSSCNRSS